MLQLTDTHCHIHEATRGYSFNSETQKKYEAAGSPEAKLFIDNALTNDVTRLLCVGTTVADSRLAVDFVQAYQQLWASIGIHPHEAQAALQDKEALDAFAALAVQPKVVAIGECGLDYFYNHSPANAQQEVLRFQIELALQHDLPMVFHVRNAFKDFWPIFDSYKGIRGVIHSFSSDIYDLEEILKRDLFVGLNGITTFLKDANQIAAVKALPLEKMVLETDAPFLTPVPFRGKLCEPKHVRVIAEFLANLRDEPLEQLASKTTANARQLFGI